MKGEKILLQFMLVLTPVLQMGCVAASPVPAPPAPIVEAVDPVPFPGAVWISGAWVWHPGRQRWEWRHGRWR